MRRQRQQTKRERQLIVTNMSQSQCRIRSESLALFAKFIFYLKAYGLLLCATSCNAPNKIYSSINIDEKKIISVVCKIKRAKCWKIYGFLDSFCEWSGNAAIYGRLVPTQL